VLLSVVACAIAANLWLVRPVRSSIGLAIILLGIPFFHYWRRQARRAFTMRPDNVIETHEHKGDFKEW